jgi:elongation factor P
VKWGGDGRRPALASQEVLAMITAGQFKRGAVITFEGAHWLVEDYHSQKTAQRHPMLHVKLRHLKNGHVVERSFDEAVKFDQPDLQSRSHQFLYEDRDGYVFMDLQTFDQLTIPAEVIGGGKWLLKEGAEFVIRLVDGRPIEVLLPAAFVDEVVETAEPSSAGHGSHVLKDARLACGLTVKVPQFIRTGEHVRVDTETHKYLGKESAKQ